MNNEQTPSTAPTSSIDWTAMKTKIKTRFSKLSDESIESAKDNMDSLSGKIQSAYGYAKDQADKEFANFKASLPVAPGKANNDGKTSQAV